MSKHVKDKREATLKQSKPFYLILLGSGVCSKSHLIKTIFHAVTKLLLY